MYNLVELFSGIGSQAKAMKNLGMQPKVIGTCEWDIHALTAYDAIHNSSEIPSRYFELSKEDILENLNKLSLSNNGKTLMKKSTLAQYSAEVLMRILAAVERNNNFVDVNTLKGRDLPGDIDVLTYSFPCQDLSNVGAFHGYNKGIDKDSGSRSSLLWQVGRILREMKEHSVKLPRYLLLENVPTLLSDRHKPNFDIWINELSDLGYKSYYYELNASFFGLPQNRPRLLMISIYVGDDKAFEKEVIKFFEKKTVDDIVSEYKISKYYQPKKMKDMLRIDYRDDTYYKEACECTPNDTVSRVKIWEKNPQLVLKGNVVNEKYISVRTITTKQDRHPNSGNLYFESGIPGKGKFRYLTPRECFLFMGFTEKDFEKVIANNPTTKKNNVLFPRDKLIRMAGNSIPVKLLEGVFLQIKIFDKLTKHI